MEEVKDMKATKRTQARKKAFTKMASIRLSEENKTWVKKTNSESHQKISTIVNACVDYAREKGIKFDKRYAKKFLEDAKRYGLKIA